MSALDSIKAIARKHQLAREFPEAVTAEVEALQADPAIDDPALVDLEDLPFVTIDHESSKDLDQAAFVARDGDGWVIWYALADAAHYVRPGSALFDEALRRGASFYLPGLMVPMLPRALSEGLVSLNPGVARRSMVFRMEVAPTGECRSTQILNARIRSRHKLSFERVQSFYDAPKDSEIGDRDVEESLRRIREVGLVRMHDAAERDVVRYRRAELDVTLQGASGLRFVVASHLHLPIERYNEQLSLLCNVEGARFLHGADETLVQPIFRVHPPPEPERVHELEAVFVEIARTHGLDAAQWSWRRDGAESLSEFLSGLPEDGPEGRVATAVHRQAILINGRSSFRAEPGIHHGVGAEVYARFSAPMREIVGVFLHKETWEKLRGRPLTRPPEVPEDEELRERIVDAANRAKDVQRDLTNAANRLVLDQLFEDDLAAGGRARVGTVMGMNRGKVYLLLDEPRVEVKVYVKHLAASMERALDASDDGLALVAADGSVLLRAGDAAEVRALGRDQRRDRWRLSLVARAS